MVSQKASVWALWALCVTLLVGCATPSVQPETPNQAMLVALEQAEGAKNTARELHAAGVLTDEEYLGVLDELDQANQALTKARALLDAGEQASAMDRVEIANEVLIGIRNRLAEERQDE